MSFSPHILYFHFEDGTTTNDSGHSHAYQTSLVDCCVSTDGEKVV